MKNTTPGASAPSLRHTPAPIPVRHLHAAAIAELLLTQHYTLHAIALRTQTRGVLVSADRLQELFNHLHTLQRRVRRMRLVVSPETLGHDTASRAVADPCLDVAEIAELLVDTARIAYGLDADATPVERKRSAGHLTDQLNEMHIALAKAIASQAGNPARYSAFEQRDAGLVGDATAALLGREVQA